MTDYLPRVMRVVLLAAFATFVLVGCQPAEPVANVDSGAKKIVEFKGGDVKLEEFQEQISASAGAQGGQAEISQGSPEYQQAVSQLLPQVVAIEVAKAYANENDITVSTEDVDREIEVIQEQVGQQARSSGEDISNEEAYNQALEQAGFTEDQLREDVRETLPLQKVQEDVTGDAGPSEEEIRSFYDQNKDQFTEPEQRCASHILFSPDQQDLANDVKQQLEDGGNFEELAKEYSQDPGSAEQGGDLGCQTETDPQTGQPVYAPPFNDALFADDAEQGDTLGPVETEFGYHLIRVNEIRPERAVPFEEAAPQIQEQLSQQEQGEAFQRWIDGQLEERNVKYLPGYDPSEVQPIAPDGGGAGEAQQPQP